MKLFFDTEFTGLQQNTTLISLAIVAENNEAIYIEFSNFDQTQVSNWLHENVFSNLILQEFAENEVRIENSVYFIKGTTEYILPILKNWLERFEKIEFMGDVSMYDWVLFCELFGGALFIPKNISYILIDFASILWARDIDPKTNREDIVSASILSKNLSFYDLNLKKHNALYDSILLKSCFESFTNKV